jgi:hypothetical protein
MQEEMKKVLITMEDGRTLYSYTFVPKPEEGKQQP